MKMKELFDKYTFDEILPYLRALEPKRLDAMHEFREAFDLLRHMEPSNEDCGELRIHNYSILFQGMPQYGTPLSYLCNVN